MNIIYIRETKETCDFIKRIVLKIKCFFNIIGIEKTGNKTIYNLPIYENKNISKFRIKKLLKKVVNNLEKDEASNVVLSKYLHTIKDLKGSLYSENLNILDGRYLFKCLSYEIIEYILKRQNRYIELSEISILINDFSNINRNLIIDIAKDIKRLKIITNNIDKCKDIENYLYNEFGILINISNNKKTSLLSSQIILNFDFPEEILNQYKIYDKAIIVNFLERILIKNKKFNGININYLKINIPKKYRIEGFKNEEIYESIIYKRDFYTIKKITTKDKIKIIRLIGNNGVIREREYMDKL